MSNKQRLSTIHKNSKNWSAITCSGIANIKINENTHRSNPIKIQGNRLPYLSAKGFARFSVKNPINGSFTAFHREYIINASAVKPKSKFTSVS